MKFKLFVAITALAVSNGAVAELNSESTLQDVISFTNGLDTRTADAFAKAEEGNLIRSEHDTRMNELSDRNYNGELLGGSAIHYDGDKVVKTDTDLTDTITGAVMRDRNGNALKVRKLETGSDSITLRGDSGTAIHNIKAGEASSDAVNVSQLNKVDQVAKAAQANSNSNAVAIGQTNNKVKTLEGNIKAVGNTAASAALAASGADAKAVTASKIGNEAKRDASSAMAVGTDAKGTANIAKDHADKLEVSKVDVSTFEADQRRQDDATQENKDRLNGVDETLVAHDQAINSTNGRIDTVSNTLTTETSNLWKDKASQKDVDNVTANLQGQVDTKADASALQDTNKNVSKVAQDAKDAGASADKANKENQRLDAVKADRTEVDAVGRTADANARGYASSAAQSSKSYTDSEVAKANGRIDSLARQQKQSKREMRSGVAGVAAMANIPTAREIGRMNIGAGTGFYKDTSAIAVGGSYRMNERVTFKGSVSTTGNDTVAGAGISYEL